MSAGRTDAIDRCSQSLSLSLSSSFSLAFLSLLGVSSVCSTSDSRTELFECDSGTAAFPPRSYRTPLMVRHQLFASCSPDSCRTNFAAQSPSSLRIPFSFSFLSRIPAFPQDVPPPMLRVQIAIRLSYFHFLEALALASLSPLFSLVTSSPRFRICGQGCWECTSTISAIK